MKKYLTIFGVTHVANPVSEARPEKRGECGPEVNRLFSAIKKETEQVIRLGTGWEHHDEQYNPKSNLQRYAKQVHDQAEIRGIILDCVEAPHGRLLFDLQRILNLHYTMAILLEKGKKENLFDKSFFAWDEVKKEAPKVFELVETFQKQHPKLTWIEAVEIENALNVHRSLEQYKMARTRGHTHFATGATHLEDLLQFPKIRQKLKPVFLTERKEKEAKERHKDYIKHKDLIILLSLWAKLHTLTRTKIPRN